MSTTTTVLKRPPTVTMPHPTSSSPKIPKSKLPVVLPPTYYGCGTPSPNTSPRPS